jgi:hypothetical protein
MTQAFAQMSISAENTLEISTSMNAEKVLGMIDAQDVASTRDALWVLWKLSQVMLCAHRKHVSTLTLQRNEPSD